MLAGSLSLRTINSIAFKSLRISSILRRSSITLLNYNNNQFYSTTTNQFNTKTNQLRKRSNQLTFLINRNMSASLGAPAKVLDGNAQAA